MAERRRVGFVVHRYSAATFGGAERHAFELARALRERYAVELITTTARDYMTWQNAYCPGIERIDGVDVRRFAVDVPRDVAEFDRASRRLLDDPDPSLAAQERWVALQGPMSSTLFAHLAHEGRGYDALCFVSYLYATTYFGLPLVAERSILLPLAHDEWMLPFPLWNRLFALAGGVVYNTPEERALLGRRFPGVLPDGPVIGMSVSPPPAAADARRFRTATGVDAPYLLYIGRIDPSKGCDALLRSYAAYRRDAPGAPDLVLIGEAHMPVPPGDGVHVAGPVDEQTKWDALAGCELLVLPSAYESLSLAVLEAWSAGKPVLVNARAAPLVGQCARSGGGLWYLDDAEFASALDVLDPPTRMRLGRHGAEYVREHYAPIAVASAFAGYLDARIAARTQAAERVGK